MPVEVVAQVEHTGETSTGKPGFVPCAGFALLIAQPADGLTARITSRPASRSGGELRSFQGLPRLAENDQPVLGEGPGRVAVVRL